MKRRTFIQTTAASSLPLFLHGMGISAFPSSTLFSAINGDSDRVLVIIQLNGGNDGLNTIIPIDQYGNLANARSNILIPESNILPLTTDTGLHPSMSGLSDLYQNAKLQVVQAVGYPDQNRSHFRSTDIWTTASASNEFLTTGWLGRYFDSEYPGYPDGYPNATCPDPFALTIGSLISETCQGLSSNFSLALNDPFSLGELNTGEPGDYPVDTCYGYKLNFVREAIAQTNAYSDTLLAAANAGNNLATYPDSNLAQKLKTVALLISGGLRTKVYVVSLGGFDTHANQAQGGDPTSGEHADLLQILSDAISAFQQDLALLQLQERVVGMTFSEFGRQIRSNSSLGTDHGDAAPMILFGSCVNPGFTGTNPQIDAQIPNQQGVTMQYDFRDVYGSLLMDWFDVPVSQVENMLYPGFTYLPLLIGCSVPVPLELVFFHGQSVDCRVELSWTTSLEINTDRFIVERSLDSVVFKTIGVVAAAGHSTAHRSYVYHTNQDSESAYYRLKMLDRDGAFSYSPVIRVQEHCRFEQNSIQPNPGRDLIYYQVHTKVDGDVVVQIYDTMQRKVYEASSLIRAGANAIPLQTAVLPAGAYTIRLFVNGTFVESKRWLRQ